MRNFSDVLRDIIEPRMLTDIIGESYAADVVVLVVIESVDSVVGVADQIPTLVVHLLELIQNIAPLAVVEFTEKPVHCRGEASQFFIQEFEFSLAVQGLNCVVTV